MIIREWRGRVEFDRQAAYPMHFRKQVLPELRCVPGFLGAELQRADHDHVVEFKVVTKWESMETIRSFAGRDYASAVVEPSAVAALIDFDMQATHHVLLEAFSPSIGQGAYISPAH